MSRPTPRQVLNSRLLPPVNVDSHLYGNIENGYLTGNGCRLLNRYAQPSYVLCGPKAVRSTLQNTGHVHGETQNGLYQFSNGVASRLASAAAIREGPPQPLDLSIVGVAANQKQTSHCRRTLDDMMMQNDYADQPRYRTRRDEMDASLKKQKGRHGKDDDLSNWINDLPRNKGNTTGARKPSNVVLPNIASRYPPVRELGPIIISQPTRRRVTDILPKIADSHTVRGKKVVMDSSCGRYGSPRN